MPEKNNWGLLFEFDSDDPLFSRAFEAGALYAEVRDLKKDTLKEVLIRTSNEVMAQRIAETLGFNIIIERALAEDGWSYVSFFRKAPVATA